VAVVDLLCVSLQAVAVCMSLVAACLELGEWLDLVLPCVCTLSKDSNWRVRKACTYDLPRLAELLQQRGASAASAERTSAVGLGLEPAGALGEGQQAGGEGTLSGASSEEVVWEDAEEMVTQGSLLWSCSQQADALAASTPPPRISMSGPGAKPARPTAVRHHPAFYVPADSSETPDNAGGS